MASHRQPQKKEHSGPELIKLAYIWGTQDRYIKLMNFKMEVSNILETKVYEISEEEKILMIKNLMG